MGDFESPADKINLAKMMIAIKKEFPLFKAILYHYPLTMVNDETSDSPDVKTAYVKWDKSGKNFKLFIHEDFAASSTPECLVFVILHEIMHTLKRHLDRALDYDVKHAMLWNLAGDHIINSSLKKDADSGQLPIEVWENCYIEYELVGKNMSTEEVYDWLKEKHDAGRYSIEMNADGKSVDITDNKTGKSQNVPIDFEAKEDGEEKSDAEKEIGKILGEMKQVYDNLSSESRGFCTGGAFDMLDELMKVELPLDVILQKSVASKLLPSISNRSWSSMNKIYQGVGITIAGKGTEIELDTAICVIDSSGSVSDKELKMAGSAVVETSQLFQKMVVLKHDAVLLDEKLYECDVSVEDLLQIHGRGGTCHQETFERIEEIFQEGELGLGIVILITDYCSNVEELFDSGDYEWCEEVPIQVLLPPGYAASVDSISKQVDNTPIVMKSA